MVEEAAFPVSSIVMVRVTARVWGRGLCLLMQLSAKARVGLGGCVWGFPFWSVTARDQLTFRVFVTLGSMLGAHEHRQGKCMLTPTIYP